MIIKNGMYKKLQVQWDTITLPLKAGTPISLGGVVANSGAALGLVPQTIYKKPDVPSINLLIGGEVFVEDVKKESGIEISNDAIKSMSGIRFFDKDGDLIDIYQKESFVLPKMDNIEDATSETIVTQFNALLAELIEKGYMGEE